MVRSESVHGKPLFLVYRTEPLPRSREARRRLDASSGRPGWDPKLAESEPIDSVIKELGGKRRRGGPDGLLQALTSISSGFQ
jgi:hypothetical protein